MKKGFTLIELLVVVLIIGILAAVALPQYRVAVAKARLTDMYQMAAGLRRAQEVYYMANSQYTQVISYLDADYSRACQPGSDASMLYCPFAIFDNITGGAGYNVAISFYADGRPEPGSGTADVWLTVWFQHSDRPNEVTCQGNNALGRQLCKTMNF